MAHYMPDFYNHSSIVDTTITILLVSHINVTWIWCHMGKLVSEISACMEKNPSRQQTLNIDNLMISILLARTVLVGTHWTWSKGFSQYCYSSADITLNDSTVINEKCSQITKIHVNTAGSSVIKSSAKIIIWIYVKNYVKKKKMSSARIQVHPAKCSTI